MHFLILRLFLENANFMIALTCKSRNAQFEGR